MVYTDNTQELNSEFILIFKKIFEKSYLLQFLIS